MTEKKNDASSQLPGAQVFSLADLVEYAEGSVVSRTLVKAGFGFGDVNACLVFRKWDA